jgi:rhodanese-related sulfurtransferase
MSTDAAPRLDARSARSWLARPDRARVLDVRSPAEFETMRIDGAINVPLPLLEQHADPVSAVLDRPVLIVCQSGVRAAQAHRRLAGAGVEHAQVLEGGMAAYVADGGEVVRGRARWSLERQVRLVAGVLVSAGLLAGLRLPAARVLSAAIGAGLTVSALTDTCTMGRLLSKLPYNTGAADPDMADVLARLSATSGTA